jgi:Phage tail tube protein
MALKWNTKILLAKIETTYGDDPTPTGAANAILASSVELKPMEGSDVSRDLETPFMGADATIPTELHAMLSFSVELAPSGAAGTAPAWGPLLRGCAVAETISAGVSVTYNSVTDGHESVTIYLLIAGTQYVLLGARGTCKIGLTAQGVPKLDFTFTGFFTKPAEATRPTPVHTGWKKPQVVSAANTPTFSIDGTDFVMKSCTLDLGNEVEGRYLVGAEEILISDKAEVFETTVNAQALTSFDPFQMALDQSRVAVALVHGTGAGRIATLDIPTAQMQRPQGLSNSQNVKEWPLRLIPIPASGNDQWTLTLT